MHQVSEVGHRRPLAVQGRHQVRPRVRRQARLAAPAHGLAARRLRVDATEFVEGIKLDIFQDQVFVFTPKGEIKDLPAGATPLDFAYRIHTDVGHRTIGAKVNNRLVPLDYRLKNGDIVEIVTTKGEHGPVARLAERRPDAATPARRSANGSSARSVTRTSSTAASRSSASCAASPGPRSPRSARTGSREVAAAAQLRHARRLLRGDRLRRGRRRSRWSCASASSTTARATLPTVAPPPQPMPRPAGSGSRASATCWSASPSAATRSRATRSWASSPAARA